MSGTSGLVTVRTLEMERPGKDDGENRGLNFRPEEHWDGSLTPVSITSKRSSTSIVLDDSGHLVPVLRVNLRKLLLGSPLYFTTSPLNTVTYSLRCPSPTLSLEGVTIGHRAR